MNNADLQETQFRILKQRLLLRKLDEVGSGEAHSSIIQEAEAAGRLARGTSCPWLVFPCLFEERARASLERFHERNARYWQHLRAA
jgi:hypothetical protein